MTRDEHIAWCKKRALEYVDRGDLKNAMTSMLSDLGKHEETKDHLGGKMGVMMAILPGSRLLHDPQEMRSWIEGFH